ncbi:MAG: DUF11 domain-containing protein, partial [Comamonadaceae bacterium]
IFADPGCTGTLQAGAAQLYPPTAPLAVLQGQSVCVLMRQVVPPAAQAGNSNSVGVNAKLVFSNAGAALSASYALADVTTAGNAALDLQKEVRNITTAGAFSAANQARSGDVLEYRVTYTNTGATAISRVIVSDATPTHTTYLSATAGAIPPGLGNCTMHTPGNPEPAAAMSCTPQQSGIGTGPLSWAFDGVLNPGATGHVLFRVTVD